MTPLILTPEAGGERLDAFLARSVEGLTRSAAQRLLEEGAVTGGGRPLKKSEKTAPGQVIQVVLPEPELVDVLPQNIPLDVVYEDSDVIVVNKPVGMVVHPAPGHPDGTLVIAIATYEKLFDKMMSNVREVKARGAVVLGITVRGKEEALKQETDYQFCVPDITDFMLPSLSILPLQLFAYYVASMKGCDIDKPRNLAKSVTVE